jgi:SPP1 gp7 family putative phage head morphogenesis protein
MTLTNNKKQLIKIYKSALNRVRAEFMRLQERYGTNMSYGQLQNLNRLSNLDKIINDEIKKLGSKTISITDNSIKTLYEEKYNEVVNKIPKEITETIGFGLIDKKAVEKSVDNTFKSVTLKNINNLQHEVNTEIAQGLIKGESYEKISKKVTERFNVSANNALRVINTETHKVVNKAAVDVYNKVKTSAENLGYKIKKKWVSVKDNRTRELHAEMDGVYADDDGNFKLPDGTVTQAPGLTGKAEHDIRCRCIFITEIIKN